MIFQVVNLSKRGDSLSDSRPTSHEERTSKYPERDAWFSGPDGLESFDLDICDLPSLPIFDE